MHLRRERLARPREPGELWPRAAVADRLRQEEVDRHVEEDGQPPNHVDRDPLPPALVRRVPGKTAESLGRSVIGTLPVRLLARNWSYAPYQ